MAPSKTGPTNGAAVAGDDCGNLPGCGVLLSSINDGRGLYCRLSHPYVELEHPPHSGKRLPCRPSPARPRDRLRISRVATLSLEPVLTLRRRRQA